MMYNKFIIFIKLLAIGIIFLITHVHPADSNKKIFKEIGMPYIKNFTEKEYNGGGQNWAVVQADNGIIYIGNNLGILVYDGVSWRIIKIQSTVRSLAIDNTGTIFFGAQGEFGYLQPDSVGQLQFHSLLEVIPDEFRKFTDGVEASLFYNGKLDTKTESVNMHYREWDKELKEDFNT